MNKQTTTYTAFVGIDWADKKHDFCIRSAHEDDSSKTFGVIPHNPAKIEEWVLSLQEKYGGQLAFAMELATGPIVYALQKYDFIDIIPIAPSTLAKYREAFSPSRAKDDPTDAELALDLILRHPERFKKLKPQSTEMRSLIALVEQRRKLVQDKIRVTNRIRSTLKQYYPQTLEVFDRIDTFAFCDFIERWPTLEKVKRARQTTLIAFFQDHNMRRKDLIEKRIGLIDSAMPLTKDKAVISTNSLQALVVSVRPVHLATPDSNPKISVHYLRSGHLCKILLSSIKHQHDHLAALTLKNSRTTQSHSASVGIDL